MKKSKYLFVFGVFVFIFTFFSVSSKISFDNIFGLGSSIDRENPSEKGNVKLEKP